VPNPFEFQTQEILNRVFDSGNNRLNTNIGALLSTVNTWTALQTFNQGNIRFGDTSDDHYYTLGVAELAADRTISLPLLAGNDTFAFVGFAQTWTANQRFNDSVLQSFGSVDGTDADIYYDGTDLIIDVNSGDLNIVIAGADLNFQQATVIRTTTGNLTLIPAGIVVVQLDLRVWDTGEFQLGADGDAVLRHAESAIAADVELAGVIVGTSNHQGTSANSMIVSTVTNDSDIQMLVNDGGNSLEFLLANADVADLQLGHGMATVTVKTASGDLTLNPGGNVVIGSGVEIQMNATGGYVVFAITDTDSATEAAIWYSAADNKLEFFNGSAKEVITSSGFLWQDYENPTIYRQMYSPSFNEGVNADEFIHNGAWVDKPLIPGLQLGQYQWHVGDKSIMVVESFFSTGAVHALPYPFEQALKETEWYASVEDRLDALKEANEILSGKLAKYELVEV
jgi:hypothetical protein